MEGLPGDWIFIDWADRLSKKGEVSFEQLLFARSLETMALCAYIATMQKVLHDTNNSAAELKKKLFTFTGMRINRRLVHSRVDGKQTDNVTRYQTCLASSSIILISSKKMQ